MMFMYVLTMERKDRDPRRPLQPEPGLMAGEEFMIDPVNLNIERWFL
ncbi:MAG: hypothetical protein JW754_02410 [Candidatus Aenigmarchaeota archaeon]|nr:hypothetical protein [Candidatus Aenigmarchaeota archaeon]